MTEVLAALPPLVAAVMLLARQRPIRASLLALASGLAVLPAFRPDLRQLASAELAEVPVAIEVLLIILGGILLFELLTSARLIPPLARWVATISGSPARRILLIVLGVVPFAESATGFGVGVVIAVPLLLRMGFAPAKAATIGLLGLVAVPWGALAPGTLVAAQLTGVPFRALGVTTAALSLPVFIVAAGGALLIGLGRLPALGEAVELIVVALSLWVGVVVVNWMLGTPLAGLLGSLAGIGALLLIVRVQERHLCFPPPDVLRSLAPYALLLVALFVAQVGVSVAAALGAPVAGGAGGGIAYAVRSPALWLLVTCAVLGSRSETRGRAAAAIALRRWIPVALTTAAFLALGSLMTVTGMATSLALGMVAHLHRGYLALAPWVGGISGYITGSNTGGNAMLAAAQANAARQLGYPAIGLVAIQTLSASLLTMASAPRVALAETLVGNDSAHSAVARVVLTVDAAILFLVSVLFLLLPASLLSGHVPW